MRRYARLLPNDVPLQLESKWIWAPGYKDCIDSYVMFRGVFTHDRKSNHPYILRITSSSEYIVFINGKEIGRGAVHSSIGYHFLDTYEVTDKIKTGKNVVAILGYNYGIGLHSRPRRSGGVILLIEKGGTVCIKTDTNWKVLVPKNWARNAPRLYYSTGFSEYFDLRNFPEGWKDVDFNDRRWYSAEINNELEKEIILTREIPYLLQGDITALPVSRGQWYLPKGIQGISLSGLKERERIGRFMAVSYCYVSEEQLRHLMEPVVQLRCDDGFLFRVNGKLVLEQRHRARFLFREELKVIKGFHHGQGELREESLVVLKPGWNKIEVEIETSYRSWGFILRFYDRYTGQTPSFVFSFNKDVDRQGWMLRKLDTRTHKPYPLESDISWDGPTLSSWQRIYCKEKTTEERMPVRLESGKYYNFDFVKESVGYPYLELKANGGEVLDIGYGEILKDNKPLTDILRYGDRLTLKRGSQLWQCFFKRGLRYLQITMRHGFNPVIINRVGLINTSLVPEQSAGQFVCSDENLNKIYEVSRHTLRLCMQEHFIDCPTREWGQYPGDALLEALQAFYIFGEFSLSRKGLRQFARIQTPDGYFRALCPSGTNHNLPDYCLIWVEWLYQHYRYTGAIELVKELLPVVEKLFGWFEKTVVGDEGLLENKMPREWWLFLDHGPIDKMGIVTGFNAWYYRALICAAYLAKETKKFTLCKKWRERAKEIKKMANYLLWSDRSKLFSDCMVVGRLSESFTQQTNILAIYTGLADNIRIRTIIGNLFTPKGEEKYPILKNENGYFKYYVLESLYKVGRSELALELIRNYWGKMLDLGATSWWETFSRFDPSGTVNSRCHAWSGAPGVILPSQVLGILPIEPGFRKILIAPKIENLNWAKGTVPTPQGNLNIEYKRKGSKLEVCLDIPRHVQYTLLVPQFLELVQKKITLR